MTTSWFQVDKAGLSKLLAARGVGRLIAELVQNAWDEAGVTRVNVILEPLPGGPWVYVEVEDDAPDGFVDLTHAYTLFAESKKKGDPTRRGRFNFGEKLFLSVARTAEVLSTKGGVRFDADGTRHQLRTKRDKGSVVTAEIRATRAELADAISYLRTLLPPPGIETFINHEPLEVNASLTFFEETLATEIADEDGALRPTRRKTTLYIHEPREGETPTLYEMGIPVVELEGGNKWHVNIGQKVPLNMDRDNVTPAYRRHIQVLVLNHMHARLSTEDFAEGTWAAVASDERTTDAAFKASLENRFGKNIVSRDLSDPEANNNAVAHGYNVLSGGHLDKGGWSRAKELGLIKPAGQVFPTQPEKKGIETHLQPDKWTDAMRCVIGHCEKVAPLLIGIPVRFAITDNTGHEACYFRDPKHAEMHFSLKCLGRAWFERVAAEINSGTVAPTLYPLFIHELAHQFESNHLDHNYHEACCKIGTTLANLVLQKPELFRLSK